MIARLLVTLRAIYAHRLNLGTCPICAAIDHERAGR